VLKLALKERSGLRPSKTPKSNWQ